MQIYVFPKFLTQNFRNLLYTIKMELSGEMLWILLSVNFIVRVCVKAVVI